MLSTAQPQLYLDTAIDALRNGDGWRSVLDELPVPIYTTDSEGSVTYWNRACVEFAGREPELGKDRWCVTWQLYTMAGEPLPHDQCPMAEAIKTRKPVRGKVAIVIRPDGSRRAFTPYPTPIFDECGTFTGAINLLIDVTDEQAGTLAEQAARCKRLSRATTDAQASQILDTMAHDYAAKAAELRASTN
jgi:PAS domain S-box-containing protein